MTQYDLLIGDPSYSSWSLRGWLGFQAFGIPTNITITRFYEPGFHQDLAPFAPAKPCQLCVPPTNHSGQIA